jgi:hypothetical protein
MEHKEPKYSSEMESLKETKSEETRENWKLKENGFLTRASKNWEIDRVEKRDKRPKTPGDLCTIAHTTYHITISIQLPLPPAYRDPV